MQVYSQCGLNKFTCFSTTIIHKGMFLVFSGFQNCNFFLQNIYCSILQAWEYLFLLLFCIAIKQIIWYLYKVNLA